MNHSVIHGLAPNLPEQIRAAAEAGWDDIGLDLASVLAHRQGGLSPAELGELARRHGLGCYEMAALVLSADPRAASGMLDLVLEAARGVRPEIVYAVSFDPVSDALFDAAGRAREALAAEGIAMAIEFVAGFGLGTLADALALAEATGDDVGLVIDVWPLVRTGSTAADVARLPPGRLAFLQLSDVAAVAAGDLANENDDGRLLPGEGLGMAPLVCAEARRLGFDGHLSLEVLHAGWRARPVAELATAGLAAVRAAWSGAAGSDLA